MKALIISADGFEDTELLVPLYRLQEAGIGTTLASTAAGVIQGKHGYDVPVDCTVEQIDADGFDLLVLPGGKAPSRLRESERVRQLARDFFAACKPVAAICHGPQILVSADLLRGRRATCYASVAGELREAGADYQDSPVVVDGDLITSRQPADLPMFMRETMARVGISGVGHQAVAGTP